MVADRSRFESDLHLRAPLLVPLSNSREPPAWIEMNGISRRAFLQRLVRLSGSLAGLGLLTGCAATAAPKDSAQPRVFRVGLFGGSGLTRTIDFWDRLAALGYVEGQNLVRDER